VRQLEIFLVPVGKNKLGTFLSKSDKWYRRHIYDCFTGPLGIYPQVLLCPRQRLISVSPSLPLPLHAVPLRP
jgi:hypothetical protein